MDSALTTAEHEAPRFFSLSQRIGRLRYFTYTLFGMIGCAVLLVLVYLFALLLPPDSGRLISTLAFILVKNFVIPLIVFVLTIRRLHDFDYKGWWALSVLMPLITLLFLCVPGSRGHNRFGPPPAPNPAGLRFAAIAIPLALLGSYVSLYGGKGGSTKQAGGFGVPIGNQSQGLKAYGQ